MDLREMELRDTVEMMNSADYKERFKAEYYQTAIRYGKLKTMVDKYNNGTLEFKPTCPMSIYDIQLRARERLYLIIVNKDIDNGKFEFPEGFESDTVMYDILEDEENIDEKYYVDSAKEKEALQEMIDSGKLRKDYSNTVRWGGRGSLDRHQWDLIQIPGKEQS